MAEHLLDTRRFKLLATVLVAGATLAACTLLAHRAVTHQRGVRGSAIYAAGDARGAYPILLRAAGSRLMSSLNAAPLLDLGDIAAWAMEDKEFLKFHRELTPEHAARLAFTAYAEALQRRPTSSTAWSGIADLFRRLKSLRREPFTGDEEDALVEASYRKAIEMEPTNYFYYAYLAEFLKEKRHDEALPLYAKAIELMPDLSWHYYLGTEGPLPDEMFQVVLGGLTNALSNPAIWRRDRTESSIGWLYERQRDYPNALKHYRNAIELAADPSTYLYQAAVVLNFDRRPDEALEYFKRALARRTLGTRLEGATLHNIGRLLLRKGDAAAACELLGQARDLDPLSYAVRMDLGSAYQAAGQIEKAGEQYQQALSIDPTRPQTYTILIDMYRGQGDYAQAIPVARRLVEMFPEDQGYRKQLDALYRLVELR